jgi:hypothetical protein
MSSFFVLLYSTLLTNWVSSFFGHVTLLESNSILPADHSSVLIFCSLYSDIHKISEMGLFLVGKLSYRSTFNALYISCPVSQQDRQIFVLNSHRQP